MPKQDILIKTYPQNKNSCSMTRRSRLKKKPKKAQAEESLTTETPPIRVKSPG